MHNRINMKNMRSKPSKQAVNLLMAKTRVTSSTALLTQFQLAVSLHQQGRWQDAAVLYDSIIAEQPGHADVWHMRGLLDAQVGEHAQAVQRISQAIAIDAIQSAYFNNRGLAYQNQHLFEDALADFQQAIALQPKLAQAHCNLGNVLQELHRHEEALICFDRAIELQPDYADAYFNRGNLYAAMLDIPKACANYDQALALNPDDVDVKFSKGNALLLAGEYITGWHLYDLGCVKLMLKEYKDFSTLFATGDKPLQGLTFLLQADQGLGDTLQFIRYAPFVHAMGARVIAEVQAPLLSLLSNMQGVDVWIKKGDALPPHDHRCQLMSLPHFFKTTLVTIPPCPVLVVDENKRRFWANKLGPADKPRVGLVWNGGPKYRHQLILDMNKRRNISLAHLKALAGIDVEFISLQKGEPAESEFRQAVTAGWDGPPIQDHVHELKDFSDTASLGMNWELVSAVDTSTAHFAASLGKPVWLLNRYDTCWRWLLEREDSPWYPSIKIYRQSTWGDWDGVMQKVRADLLAFLPPQPEPNRTDQ